MKNFFTLTDSAKGFLQIILIIAIIWIIIVVAKRIFHKNILPIQDGNGDISLSNLTLHTGNLNPPTTTTTK